MTIQLDPSVVWDAVPDPLLLVEGRVTIAGLNAAAERFFGYRSDDVTGRSLDLLLPAGRVLLAGSAGSLIVAHARLRDRMQIPVSVGAAHLPGHPEMSIAVVRDMRELVQWRLALEEAIRRGNDDRAQQLYAAGLLFRSSLDLEPPGPGLRTAIDRVLAAIDDVIVGLGRSPTDVR